ncbi:MAG TPA: hypothetical protein VG917_02150 [Patescibacteria group bacterium]|nr:hypothetical protein [Patescibacteria group bacterium]
MKSKKRTGKKPYYGRKGGAAVYNREISFDISSTLDALRDYYKGKKIKN